MLVVRSFLRHVLLTTGVMLSHYRQHVGQAVFLLLGLVLGVALWSSVQLVNDHAKASYQESDQLLGAQAKYLIRPSFEQTGVPHSALLALTEAGFSGLYPVMQSTFTPAGTSRSLTVMATDLEQLDHLRLGASFIPLPLFTLVPQPIADELGIQPRQAIKLANGQFLPPAVIMPASSESSGESSSGNNSRNNIKNNGEAMPGMQGDTLITHIRHMKRLLNSDTYDYIGVPALPNERIAALQAALPAGVQLVRNQQALDLQELTQSLHIQLAALGWLAFVVGLFIVFNAVRFSLHSRAQSMQTLRELGTPVSVLTVAIALEALLWALAGTLLGGAAGFFLANALLPSVAASLQSIFGAMVSPAVTLSPQHWWQASAMTLLGVLLAVAGPLWFSARNNLKAKVTNNAQLSKPLLALLVASPVLLLASALLSSQANTVTGGFIMLTLTLFGCALLLPVVLWLAAKLVAKVLPERLWIWRWAVSDAFAQLPHLRIAMMAVLLALVANIGVSLLVGSFRVALSDWLTVRLSASVYLQPQVPVDALAQDPNIIAAHTRFGVNSRWGNRPAEILGVNTQAPDMQSLPMQSGQVDWSAPEHVVVNEQAHFLQGAQLGDKIALKTETGTTTFTITGFFHDYGNSYYSFYVPKEVLLNHWPSAEPLGSALWLSQDAQTLMDQYEIASDDWIDQQALFSIALAIFDRTFAITGALNTLTFAVAGIALFAALLSVHQQRLDQYRQWRALGVSVKEWAVIVMVPILLMVVVTFLLSVPIGIWLSALLVNDINVIAFGWSMPLAVQWQPFAWLLGFTLLMYIASSGIAAWRVAKQLA